MMMKQCNARIVATQMVRVLICISCAVAVCPLLVTFGQSGVGGHPANAETLSVVTPDNPQTFVIERAKDARSAKLPGTYLTLELEVLFGRLMAPYALELSVFCEKECPDSPAEVHDRWNIGEINLFPAPKPGEKRSIQIAISDAELPAMPNRLRVGLRPIIVDREDSETAIRINSVTLREVRATK